jgi:two-component system response regulator AtoC
MLVVSREPSSLAPLWTVASQNGWELEVAGSGCEALERSQAGAGPSLVLLHLAHADGDGLYTLRWLRRVRPEVPVLLLAHSENHQQRIEGLRMGAQDYLVRPFYEQQLEAVMRQHLRFTATADAEIASESVERLGEDTFFAAASNSMRKLRAQAELLAQVDVPVLIVGESGSGKETIAQLIHKLSLRSGFGFSKINCAALPGELLERELFGYESPGASGAARSRPGKLEMAQKGTLLLDDIAELPLPLQARLVHVLQEKQSFRAGGEGRIEVDVRIIAATSQNLEQAIANRTLREDLYYRLSAFTVHVPPLRQRREEIPLLMGYLMNRVARHYGLPARMFSRAVLEACQAHSWPGNLRELENFVKRYLVVGDEDLALSELGRGWEHLPEHAFPAVEGGTPLPGVEPAEVDDSASGLRSLVQSVKGEAERNAIAAALEQTRWNRKAAARLLKVSYRTLLYKIQQYHMSPPPTYLPNSFTGQGVKGGNGQGH